MSKEEAITLKLYNENKTSVSRPRFSSLVLWYFCIYLFVLLLLLNAGLDDSSVK